MKLSILPASFLMLTILPAWSGADFTANRSSDIPYGIEAVTQYRTEYNYRGFKLAQQTLEFQLGGQYAMGNGYSLSSAAWYGTETSDGDFTELGAQAEFRKDIGEMSYLFTTAYRDFSDGPLESGLDLTTTAVWHFNEQFDISSNLSYDTGADGWYANAQGSYYQRINDDSFITLSSGISAVTHYYDRSGLNDIFAKVSYTYNINQTVSISPYIGTSVLIDDDAGGDSFYGGIYFAVAF